MSRSVIAGVGLLLVSFQTYAGEFCAIDNYGNQQACFPVMNMCEQWVAHQIGASCVFGGSTSNAGTARNPSNADYYAAGQGIGLLIRSLSPRKSSGSGGMTERAAGQKCDQLGFRVGSPAYHECVEKLIQ